MKDNNFHLQLIKILKKAMLRNDILEDLINDFGSITFCKNQVIQDTSMISQYLYFLKKGIARHYYTNHNYDKESTVWFSKENDFVANAGFFTQKPVNEIIVALEDIEAYTLSYNDFEKHCRLSHELERFVRDLLAEQLFLFDKYNSETFLLSAADRYQNFLVEFPEIVLRVPLKYIASFLCVTPETLSRVRAYK